MNAEQFLSVDRPAAITAAHVLKFAIIYVRQSSLDQVREHSGSTSAQRDLRHFALRWGWPESRGRVIDCDLGLSRKSAVQSPVLPSIFRVRVEARSGQVDGQCHVSGVHRTQRLVI